MNVRMLRRPAVLISVGVVVAGATSLVLERAGLYTCDCYPECWCKRPGLQLFRWIDPRFHQGPWNPEDKALHEQALLY